MTATELDLKPENGTRGAHDGIQPHGVLLVVEGGCVVQLAGDTQRVFGQAAGQLLGKPLSIALATCPDHRIARALESSAPLGYLGSWPPARPGERSWEVTGRRTGRGALLAWEPWPLEWRSAAEGIYSLSRALDALEEPHDLPTLCATAVAEVRRLTGFDRVVLYRLLGGAGQIVAEDRGDALPPLMEQRMPLPDGPGQSPLPPAYLQVIPDVDYIPGPLTPAPAGRPDTPADLDACVLCGVTPARRLYLKNLGVAASLSLPVFVEGEPWGAIACHHHGPRLAPYEIRESCIHLARMLARRLQRCETPIPARERQATRELVPVPQPLLAERSRLLVQEAHHRVQNSLHIVGSLLRLQARQTVDAQVRSQLDGTVGRLMAVGTVHRHLWQSHDMRSVRLDHYLEQLCADLAQSWGEGWAGQLTVAACDVTIAGDRAVTLSLVVTELLTNAAKYAYGGAPGRVDVAVEKAAGELRVSVRDQGAGMPTGGRHEGLGSKLVRMFTAQLGGRAETHSNGQGTAVTIHIPLEPLAHAPAAPEALSPPPPATR